MVHGLIYGWAYIWNGLSVGKHGGFIFGRLIFGRGRGAYSQRFTVLSDFAISTIAFHTIHYTYCWRQLNIVYIFSYNLPARNVCTCFFEKSNNVCIRYKTTRMC